MSGSPNPKPYRSPGDISGIQSLLDLEVIDSMREDQLLQEEMEYDTN